MKILRIGISYSHYFQFLLIRYSQGKVANPSPHFFVPSTGGLLSSIILKYFWIFLIFKQQVDSPPLFYLLLGNCPHNFFLIFFKKSFLFYVIIISNMYNIKKWFLRISIFTCWWVIVLYSTSAVCAVVSEKKIQMTFKLKKKIKFRQNTNAVQI